MYAYEFFSSFVYRLLISIQSYVWWDTAAECVLPCFCFFTCIQTYVRYFKYSFKCYLCKLIEIIWWKSNKNEKWTALKFLFFLFSNRNSIYFYYQTWIYIVESRVSHQSSTSLPYTNTKYSNVSSEQWR